MRSDKYLVTLFKKYGILVPDINKVDRMIAKAFKNCEDDCFHSF